MNNSSDVYHDAATTALLCTYRISNGPDVYQGAVPTALVCSTSALKLQALIWWTEDSDDCSDMTHTSDR